MKRYTAYILVVVVLVGLQVQFDILGRTYDVVRTVVGVPQVFTDTTELAHDVAHIRDATIETIEKVLTPKEPLFVISGDDISDTHLTTAGIVIETNIERALNAQPSLKENPVLSQAAYNKAKDLLDDQYFAHVSPDGRGPSDVVGDVGYDYILVGENLAMGIFEDDRDLVAAWMNSPGHRANILHPRFSEIGVGIVQGEYKGRQVWIAVQEFGLPKNACPQINSNLAYTIEENQAQLEVWEERLLVLRQKIEEDRKREDVRAYNALVDDFNDLVGETKEDIATYNSMVRAYNACVSG